MLFLSAPALPWLKPESECLLQLSSLTLSELLALLRLSQEVVQTIFSSCPEIVLLLSPLHI